MRLGLTGSGSQASGIAQTREVESAEGKAENAHQSRSESKPLEQGCEPILRFNVFIESEAVQDLGVQVVEVNWRGLLVPFQGERPAQSLE
jgi:hypothetical protein